MRALPVLGASWGQGQGEGQGGQDEEGDGGRGRRCRAEGGEQSDERGSGDEADLFDGRLVREGGGYEVGPVAGVEQA